jgi:hypothetical protein
VFCVWRQHAQARNWCYRLSEEIVLVGGQGKPPLLVLFLRDALSCGWRFRKRLCGLVGKKGAGG